MRFDGRVALVTGAAGGIGQATVERLLSEGCAVAAVDLNAAVLDEFVAASASDRVVAIVADVTDGAQCEAAVSHTAEVFGRLDVLVNNAAVGAFGLDVESTSEDQWDRILRINLTSAYLMSRPAIPLIRAAGGGAIINVSSIHAYATSTGVAPYAAAKGGLLALTRTMALDLAKDRIRVTCLVPGAVDTPMLHQHAAAEGVSLAELGFSGDPTQIGRIAQPAELAAAIAFLASSDASFVTGSALIADGGVLAKF